MTPWDSVGARAVTLRRTHDWLNLLSKEWYPLLDRVANPAGLNFLGRFEGTAGEAEYELARDDSGYIAVGLEAGVAPQRLNATEAEFQALSRSRVLAELAQACGCTPNVRKVARHAYVIGCRHIEGKRCCVIAAPLGAHAIPERELPLLSAKNCDADATMLLAPSRPTQRLIELLRGQGTAVAELPLCPPFLVDWSVLIADSRFGVSVADPATLLGERFVIVVDREQQRIWVEQQELTVHAGSQPYALLAYLCERPRVRVPVEDLANKVLSAEAGERGESKVISDAKDQLRKKLLSLTLQRTSADVVKLENKRAYLDLAPELVKVIRSPSEA
jgi:hypothetical protein